MELLNVMDSFAASIFRPISLLRSDLIVLKIVPSNFLRVGINFKYSHNNFHVYLTFLLLVEYLVMMSL